MVSRPPTPGERYANALAIFTLVGLAVGLALGAFAVYLATTGMFVGG